MNFLRDIPDICKLARNAEQVKQKCSVEIAIRGEEHCRM